MLLASTIGIGIYGYKYLDFSNSVEKKLESPSPIPSNNNDVNEKTENEEYTTDNLEDVVRKELDDSNARVVEYKVNEDKQLSFEDKSIPKTVNFGYVEYELKRPKYHPSIEDFEKKLKREISILIPTYYEIIDSLDGEINDPELNDSLKEKFSKTFLNSSLILLILTLLFISSSLSPLFPGTINHFSLSLFITKISMTSSPLSFPFLYFKSIPSLSLT